MFDEVSLSMGKSQARECLDALGHASREINDMILRAPAELTRRERAKFVGYCEAIVERLDALAELILEQLAEFPDETEEERRARWPEC